jgi:hypothetical protein
VTPEQGDYSYNSGRYQKIETSNRAEINEVLAAIERQEKAAEALKLLALPPEEIAARVAALEQGLVELPEEPWIVPEGAPPVNMHKDLGDLLRFSQRARMRKEMRERITRGY